MAIPASKVDTFINAISKPGYRLDGEAEAKALSFIDLLPLSDKNLNTLSGSHLNILRDAANRKHQQRRDDFVQTLFDAVDAGCENLDDVAQWLGVDADSNFDTLMTRGHAYRRLGIPGRPETVPVG